MLLTNTCELFGAFPRKKKDRAIFKKVIDKKTGEILNLKDFAKLSINYHHPEIDIKDIMFKENSEEELYNAMKEYLDFINKKNHLDNIQIKFNEFLHKRLEEIYNEDVVKNNFFKFFLRISVTTIYIGMMATSETTKSLADFLL